MHRQPQSAQSIPSPIGQQRIPADLRCFLCNSLFEEPLLLSCAHSFCRRCVEPWLRQSTNCPCCRFTTLAPIRNITLTEKIEDYKRKNGKSTADNFLRSFVRRTMRPSKEARTLQREALRASQRRPKNVVLPERSPNSLSVREMAASLEGKLRLSQNGRQKKEGGEQKEGTMRGDKETTVFPRMGNLRRSFARIRHKMGGKQISEEAESQTKGRSNSSSGLHTTRSHPNATIGELLARNQQAHGSSRLGGIGAIGFTEINLQSPGNLSRYSCTSGTRRPSMGLSGSALRRIPSSAEEPKSEVKQTAETNAAGTKHGCALM